jgi:D-alanyl-D-alanine carboxypeptidase
MDMMGRKLVSPATAMLVALCLFLSGCTAASVLSDPPPPIPSEKYAAIVVDVHSGQALYSAHADQLRYPASLTKMMTVFMLLETLDQGRITTATMIPVSENARAQVPTKIGFNRGDSIDVDSAIRALVIRSANDVAVAVAEYLGGTEDNFGTMMTQRARQMGMNSTTFRNASGLPNPGQQTTARDMALLSIALRKRFPHHYHYFGNREFTYAGRTIRGHNELLGTVNGVDGLKTGYIRASGFNLATSVNRGGRQMVAVVMGGETARSRNAHMQELIEKYMPMVGTTAPNAPQPRRPMLAAFN